MRDKGKILAEAYELILGREMVNNIVGIGQHDKTLALQLMALALRTRLGEISAAEALREINLIEANYVLPQVSIDEEE